jgi:hypothetical protein
VQAHENDADHLKRSPVQGGNDMLNETPRFIHGIAGARPAHQWPGPRPPGTEWPTWHAHLIIVVTREFEPDQAPSEQEKG